MGLPSPVISVLTNPKRDDIVAIGYESGIIVEWDIKSRKCIAVYEFTHNLVSICWDIKGQKIYAGYENGEMAIWKHKRAAAKRKYFPIQTNLTLPPIRKILVTSIRGDRVVFVLGGCYEPNMIIMDAEKEKHHIFLCDESHEIRDVSLIFKYPDSQTDPTHILWVTQKGEVGAHSLHHYQTKQLNPPSIRTCNPKNSIVSTILVPIDSEFYEHLNFLKEDEEFMPDAWPVRGGIDIFIDSEMNPYLLLTLHEEGSVRLWASLSSCHLSYLFEIESIEKPSCFDFCVSSRQLFIGSWEGNVVYYEFHKEENEHVDSTTRERTMSHSKSMTNIREVDKKEAPTLRHSKSRDSLESLTRSPDTTITTTKKNGFSVSCELEHDLPIVVIKYESRLELLAVATDDGRVYIYRKEEGTFKRILSSKFSSQKVSKFEFCEVTMKDGHHLILFIFYMNGTVIPMSVTTQKKLDVLDRSHLFLDSFLVDGKGVDITQGEKIWKPIYKDDEFVGVEAKIKPRIAKSPSKANLEDKKAELRSQLKQSTSAQRSPSKATIMTPSHSLVQNKNTSKPTKKVCGFEYTDLEAPPTPLEKYLIICSIHEICVYTIPEFSLIQKKKMNECMSWYGKASIQKSFDDGAENCIYGVDHHGNIHVWTLLGLHPVLKEKKFNLNDYGVKDLSPLEMRKTCYSENGRFFMFSEKEETFSLNLLIANTAFSRPTLITYHPSQIVKKPKSTLRGLLGSKKEVNLQKVFDNYQSESKESKRDLNRKDDKIKSAKKKSDEEISEDSPETSRKQNLKNSSNDSDTSNTTLDAKEQDVKKSATKDTSQKGTKEIGELMAEANIKLQERGERLNLLSEKTERMETESSNFASMARQLKESQKRKKGKATTSHDNS